MADKLLKQSLFVALQNKIISKECNNQFCKMQHMLYVNISVFSA